MVKNVMVRMTAAMNNFFSGITSAANDIGEIHTMLMDLHRPGGMPY
ncbi:MAG: hypothetical protein ACOY40_18370 [Bacillota bacterium]